MNKKYAWNNEKVDGICYDLWLGCNGGSKLARGDHAGRAQQKLYYVLKPLFRLLWSKVLWHSKSQDSGQSGAHATTVRGGFHTEAKNTVQGRQAVKVGTSCSKTVPHMTKKKNKKKTISVSWLPSAYTVWPELTGWFEKQWLHVKKAKQPGVKRIWGYC